MEIIVILILSVIIICAGYAIFNLLKTVESAEEENERILNMYDSSIELISKAHKTMEEIDHKGAFQSEDEVGTTFKMLRDAMIDLVDKLNKLNG